MRSRIIIFGLLVVLVLLISIVSRCRAKEVSFSYNTMVHYNESLYCNTDYHSYAIKYTTDEVEKYGLNFGLQFRFSRLEAEGIKANQYGINLSARKLFKKLYVRFFGGFSILSPSDDQPDLGGSGILGGFGAGVGKRFGRCFIEYTIRHDSDPFNGGEDGGDKGRNYQQFEIGYSF